MEYVKLSEITEVITKGTTPTSIGYNFCDEGINFIKIESIDSDGKILNDKVGYISKECHNKLKRSQLKENDILFSIAGAIGRTCIITEDILPANTNQALAIIRLKEKDYDIEYLKILLNSQFISKQYNKRKQGVAQLNLSLTDIGNLEIPKLNITEQLNIKHKLKRVNKMILIRKQEINKCIDLIKSQFLEMFDNVNYEQIELNNLCDVRDGTHDSPKYLDYSEYKFITSKNIVNGSIDFTEVKYINKEDYDKFNIRSKVNKGDILMPMIGTIGNPIVVDIENDKIDFAIKNVALIKFKDESKVINVYIKNYLDSKYFEAAISQNKRGGTQKFIALSDIRKIKVKVPPLELQNKFAKIVQQIDKQKIEFEKSLKKLEELQASLMQEYFG